MTSYCVPREVNGKWYPVPCPEGVSIGQSFPTREACMAACETSEAYGETLERERMQFDEKLGAESEESYERGQEAGEEAGYETGYENAREECHEGTCPGYDVGRADGYAQGKEVARSAESA